MNTRTSAVKSKSNYVIPSKMEKKCTSDADFTPVVVKKRGVYVDRRESLSPVSPTRGEGKIIRKPPPRPKPSQKKFLASVLTILSKSTTGTQHPEENNEIRNKAKSKLKRTEKSKRKSYKSRVLNNYIDENDEDFVVLQSKKDIVHTPSIFSNKSTLQEEKPKIRSVRDALNCSNYSDVVLEGKTRKIRISDDPETLVNNINDKDDGKIYNLFVDLLQSTFNDFKDDGILSEESKTVFGIDENVAKKLVLHKPEEDIINSEVTTFNTPLVKEYKSYKDLTDTINIKLSDHKIFKPTKPKITTKSFIRPKKSTIKQTYSFQEKKSKRKSRKEDLLNLLKEQLQMQPMLEEPQTFFQSLKVMAKNKKVYERSLSNIQKTKSTDNEECTYKWKEIIKLKSNKKLGKNRSVDKNNSERNRKSKKVVFESNHSLEVFELNYEEPSTKVHNNHDALLDSSNSQSDIENNLDYYTLLKYSDSSACNFY